MFCQSHRNLAGHLLQCVQVLEIISPCYIGIGKDIPCKYLPGVLDHPAVCLQGGLARLRGQSIAVDVVDGELFETSGVLHALEVDLFVLGAVEDFADVHLVVEFCDEICGRRSQCQCRYSLHGEYWKVR